MTEKHADTDEHEKEIKEKEVTSETAFNFPHFMKFDLKNWKKISEKEYEEGDSWGTIYRYQKDNQILEFNDGLSSYGYFQAFQLFDSSKKILKKRDFYYSDGFLNETVVDYTTEPAQEYKRNQEKKVDYKLWESTKKPLLVSGDWLIAQIKGETK